MSKAFEGAVRLLSRREHGADELYQKLIHKGHAQSDIKQALDECQRLGLQSDSRFVDNVLRVRIRQGYGPVRIAQELKNLRIDRALIDTALQQEQANWLAYATAAWKKKYKTLDECTFVDVQKQKQFLLYRRFSTAIINGVFKAMIAMGIEPTNT